MYSKILTLRFPRKIVNEPIAVNLVKKFDLSFNILKATIYPRKEGLMVLELSGHRKNFQRGVRYLKGLGIKVESIGQDEFLTDSILRFCLPCCVPDRKPLHQEARN